MKRRNIYLYGFVGKIIAHCGTSMASLVLIAQAASSSTNVPNKAASWPIKQSSLPTSWIWLNRACHSVAKKKIHSIQVAHRCYTGSRGASKLESRTDRKRLLGVCCWLALSASGSRQLFYLTLFRLIRSVARRNLNGSRLA